MSNKSKLVSLRLFPLSHFLAPIYSCGKWLKTIALKAFSAQREFNVLDIMFIRLGVLKSQRNFWQAHVVKGPKALMFIRLQSQYSLSWNWPGITASSVAFVFCGYIFLLFFVANFAFSPVLAKTQNKIYLHYTSTLSLETFRMYLDKAMVDPKKVGPAFTVL